MKVHLTVEYDDATDNLIFVAPKADMAFAIPRDGNWSKAPTYLWTLLGLELKAVNRAALLNAGGTA